MWCTSKHLLFNHVGGLIVEDGPQAVGVSRCFWVQAEVQGHINGGKFIPEFFLILYLKKHKFLKVAFVQTVYRYFGL